MDVGLPSSSQASSARREVTKLPDFLRDYGGEDGRRDVVLLALMLGV